MSDEAVYRTAPATPGLLNIKALAVTTVCIRKVFLDTLDLTNEARAMNILRTTSTVEVQISIVLIFIPDYACFRIPG